MRSRIIQCLIYTCCFISASGQTSEFSDTNFDVMRLENEVKLSVPNSISDSVWQFLQTRYQTPNSFLKEIDNAFHSSSAVDLFIDQYYDNEDMQLLKFQYGVRHRSRYVLTDSTDDKHGRQLVQIKIDDVGENTLNRSEYKYKSKPYAIPENSLDGHPFFGRVHKGHREQISRRLHDHGIDPLKLVPSIKIEQLRKRIYISYGHEPFATLTLDSVTAVFNGETAQFTELELELNEINYTQADPISRHKMETVNDMIKGDLLAAFPSIEQDQTPKYNKAFEALGLQDLSSGFFSRIKKRTLSAASIVLLFLAFIYLNWRG